MPTRRSFLGKTAIGVGGAMAVSAPSVRSAVRAATRDRRVETRRRIVRPPRLGKGDVVGLINPCSVPLGPDDLETVRARVEALGLRLKEAPGIRRALESPESRADDVNALFADGSVKAILPVRGGWGCARVLQHLDYAAIQRHPKILMGYSDVAALLLGINARTGLVTFHGPMGTSPWVPYAVEHMRKILFAGEAATLCGTTESSEGRSETRFRTITSGKARGRLIGGNLTVLSSIVGSPYLDGSADIILFLEEVREPISEVDRMLTQLDLAGVLGRVRGFVFGQCTRCPAPAVDGSLTLDRVLDDHIRALGIPAWRGAPIGHVERQITVPIGLPVEMNADLGTIRLLGPAVV